MVAAGPGRLMCFSACQLTCVGGCEFTDAFGGRGEGGVDTGSDDP